MSRALFTKPPHRFKAADHVRCNRGPMRGQHGVVIPGRDGRIRAGPDQIWVIFDAAKTPVRARRGALKIML